MALHDICHNLCHDREGSSPSFMKQKQWGDHNKTPLKLCVLSQEHCWAHLWGANWGVTAEQTKLGMPKETSTAQPLPKLKHSELHLSVQVLHQTCQVLTLANIQLITGPQHLSPPAFQRGLWELLLCWRGCHQKQQWCEHTALFVSELILPFTADIFGKL